MKRFISWASLAGIFAIGCGSKPQPGAIFVFDRPQHVEFVCLDRPEKPGDEVQVRPLRCCSARTPLARDAFFPSDAERKELCGADLAQNDLHALVTQSARGEVAAVDLEKGKVLDSNRRIPGATFVDVGGLPAAIITPREVEQDGKTTGSPWTFVASGEDYSVRAIATCRFVVNDGVDCGPERIQDEDAEKPIGELDELERRAVLEIPLPSAPADMVYLDGALWVTLPDDSAIARIDLAPQGKKQSHPFVEEDGRAALPTFFHLDSVTDVDPGEPIREEEPYLAVCGLEYAPVFSPLEIGRAPMVMSTGIAAPRRLRVDETNGLLLVGDRSQPVVHALAVQDGELWRRGVVKTGAPVLDFVVTPPVPRTAPTFEELTPKNPKPSFELDGDQLVPTQDPSRFSSETSRYIYAIDDRDGTLIATTFDVDADTGFVSSSLLEAPYRSATGARDRLNLNGTASALEVIDTRVLTGDHLCNVADAEGLDPLIDEVEKKGEKASEDEKELWSENLETLEAARRLALGAGFNALRGVFVAVIDARGLVTIIDVHDADMFCRAGEWCTGNGAGEASRSDEVGPDPLGVQRHAARRRNISEVRVALSNESALSELECPEGMFDSLADSDDEDEEPTLVCTSADPWTSFPTRYEVEYEDYFGGDTGTWLERDGERLILRGAPGLDFCARGVVADAIDGEGEGYAGDWVVAFAAPPPSLEGCVAPAQGREPQMRVIEAYADRLVLDAPEIPSGTSGAPGKPYDPNKLLDCFPTSMPTSWRVNDRYLVSWAGPYLHRIVASEVDGSCVEDQAKDARLTSRAEAGEVFQNPYVAFRLSDLEDGSSPSSLNNDIQVSGGADGIAEQVYAPTRSNYVDSQPAVIRYLDTRGELFIVDITVQGLRRFGLSPFENDGNYYR